MAIPYFSLFKRKPLLPETKLLKIYFKPLPDITAYELAFIVKNSGWLGLNGPILIPEDTWIKLDFSIHRHFGAEP